MTKLSIIVPVYNVAPYLRKCVSSLLAQDYANYEIILVDDGSSDGSGELCDELASNVPKDSNDLKDSKVLKDVAISVIHQPNGGLSAARNTGIAAAKGEYVMFVDSDDFVEPNVISALIAQLERDNLDVLRYRLQYVRIKNEGVRELGNEGEYEVYNPYKGDSFKGNDYSSEPTDGVSFLNSRMNTQCYAWQFIIRRDLIMSIQKLEVRSQTSESEPCLFTPGIYFEDVDWTPRMLVRAKRVASTETVVYDYLVREGSITNAVNRSKQKKVLDDKIRLIGEMQRQSRELEQKGLSNVWFSRMIASNVISIIGIISHDFYNRRKEYLTILENQHIYPIDSKSTKARLINLSPRMAVELLHFKNH